MDFSPGFIIFADKHIKRDIMANKVEFRKYPRAKWHDYNAGIYFVTVCTWDKIYQFGHIADNRMLLNMKGRVVDDCINSLPTHYPDVEVHNHIVMPNHIHLLLQIVPSWGEPSGSGRGRPRPYSDYGAVHKPKHDDTDIPFEQRCHFNSRIAVIIGGLKSGASRRIHGFDAAFKWQRRFHEHLVRNQRTYDNINAYISENPQRWATDTLNL